MYLIILFYTNISSLCSFGKLNNYDSSLCSNSEKRALIIFNYIFTLFNLLSKGCSEECKNTVYANEMLHPQWVPSF